MGELLVVVGGLATGEEPLEKVAHAAVHAGMARDAVIYTLPRAMRRTDELSRRLNGAISLAHSLGSLPVSLAVDSVLKPELVVACNGTEPMEYRDMVRRGLAKRREARNNDETRAILGHNTAQMRNRPLGNLGPLRQMRSFSTFASLAEFRGRDIPTLAVVCDADILAPYKPELNIGQVDVLQLAGSHDELLLRPTEVMQAIVNQIAQR